MRGAVLLALGAACAQAQTEAVIRSTTRLVEVHVVAVDGAGNPAPDLRRADFQIFDEKKEQPVVLFTAEGGAGPQPRAAARRSLNGAGYSAVLLDWLNAEAGDRLRGSDAFRKALATVQPRQSIGAFVLGEAPPNSAHPLRTIWNFREAGPDLSELVADPGILPSPERVAPAGRFDARFGGGGRRLSLEEQLFDWNNRILDTVRALTELGERMSRLPGRKSIVWLTTGFPMMLNGSVIPGAAAAEASYLPDLERVLGLLNRNDIAVHVVDTRGLSTGGRSFGDTEEAAAERTGGTVFADRNDLDAGIRVALDDLHSGYTLGFLAPEGAAPGPHRIEVRVRRTRIRLRFRESYDPGSS